MHVRYEKYQLYRTVFRRSLLAILVFVLAMSLCASGFTQAGSAYAITENTEAELNKAQERIEKTTAAYNEAIAELEAIEDEIEKTQEKILELESSITKQKEISSEAAVQLYKWYGNGFNIINLVFSAGSLKEFINSVTYHNRAQQAFIDELERLELMRQKLDEESTALDKMKQDTEKAIVKAEDALKDAQAARVEAQRKAEEEAAAEAEAAAKAIANAQAQESAEVSGANPSNSGNVTINDVDWSSDKATFVSEWGTRIDAYLSGSPLAGQGRTFAAAAWDYGVDPRYSPAISHTESTKGLYCFRPYNAWGWGQYSWSSWEEAINAHVRGLSRGYSYTICLEDAKKYCENWEHWYNTTLKQMNMI